MKKKNKKIKKSPVKTSHEIYTWNGLTIKLNKTCDHEIHVSFHEVGMNDQDQDIETQLLSMLLNKEDIKPLIELLKKGL